VAPTGPHPSKFLEHMVIGWLCHSCQDQGKRMTQRETPIAWGKVKDKENQRKSKLGIWKKLYVNPERKNWKSTNCQSVSSYRTFQLQ